MVTLYVFISYFFTLGKVIVVYNDLKNEDKIISIILFLLSPIVLPIILGMDNELKNKK